MNRCLFIHSMTVLLAIAAIPLGAQQQLWTITRGGGGYDGGVDAVELPDDGFIIAGYTGSFKSIPTAVYSTYLMRVDSKGVVQWERAVGKFPRSSPAAMFLVDNELVIIGHGDTTGAGTELTVYFGRFDLDGFPIEEKLIRGPTYLTVLEARRLATGDYIAAGRDQFGSGVWKISRNGDLLWARSYALHEGIVAIDTASGGGYVATGSTDKPPAIGFDPYVLRLDDDGDSLWLRTFGSSEAELAKSKRQTPDGGMLLAGQSGTAVVLTRLTAVGGFVSTRREALGTLLDFQYMERDGEGYMFVGSSGVNTSYGKIILGRIDDRGNPLWSIETGGSHSSARMVKRTSDGGFILLGDTQQTPNIYASKWSSEIVSGVAFMQGVPMILTLE